MARLLGLGLWIVFAPAAIGLLPRTLFWRHALPIEGVTGRLLADAMVQYLNLPGASIVLALMVLLSVYLATTFTFHTPASGRRRTSPAAQPLRPLHNWRTRRALAAPRSAPYSSRPTRSSSPPRWSRPNAGACPHAAASP